MRYITTLSLTLLLFSGAFAPAVLAQDSAAAVTTANVEIDRAELEILLYPLTLEELHAEAKAWQAELRSVVEEIGDVELRVLRRGDISEAAADVQQAHDADQQMLVELSEKRDRVIGRLELVLSRMTSRIGLDENKEEPAEVKDIRRYINGVDGLSSDAADASTIVTAFREWLGDEDRGVRVAKNVILLIGFTVAFWLLGTLLAKAINKAMSYYDRSSEILASFVSTNLPKFMLFIGLLVGLDYLDFNITPLLAIIGGASFVIAFALQDTLSNFASGIMIMLYRPFDKGDFVDVAGIQGSVKSMTLVSTTITTIDNKMIVVPNNSIWGDVITNYTGVHERRVDLTFGIGYEDDIDKAEAILTELATAHPKTLDDPAPIIKLHELGDSSVNFICRPWVKTEDYWGVYWDLMRSVKKRFDAEGISIPFPQTDVHLYAESAADSVAEQGNDQESKRD